MSDNLPHMDYRQHRRARRLVHECCNYDEGNCLLLDDGEPCVCVQSISFSLMCHWFRVAVLPLDGELAAALLCRGSRKRCAVCGAAFVPKSNRGATYPEIKARVLEQTGLKVSSLYISQVKQKCGLEVRENHHKAKSENTKQPQCPKEKEDAIVEALKHFQMI